jgi:2-iminobutanoate/2-iminopropanoate deaminase
MAIEKRKVNYPGIPEGPNPMGPAPLSPAVVYGNMMFISGQVSIDPKTGKVVGSDAKTQTRQALENMRSLLETMGGTMDNVVSVNIHMTDVSYFGDMNSVYREYFKEPFPARNTATVRLANPNLKVEISAIAILPSS